MCSCRSLYPIGSWFHCLCGVEWWESSCLKSEYDVCFEVRFGNTVAYISIRFIVGVSRAGIGYGLCGIFGNLTATVVPIIGGSQSPTTKNCN